MSKVRSAFQQQEASIVAVQCLWRRKQAKRELRRLKKVKFFALWEGEVQCSKSCCYCLNCFSIYLYQEANEAGALRLAKSKLEKQLEELTWRLHLEKKLRVLP